jgi:hypothetical protein
VTDTYLSKPVMDSPRRRLFTFTQPILLLTHTGPLLATAAEGVEDDEAREGMRFLVLDTVWTGTQSRRINEHQGGILGTWLNAAVIASEQVQLPSAATTDAPPEGRRIRTKIDDCDDDGDGHERPIPAGTLGTVGPLEDDLHTINWDNGGVTRWTPEEIATDAEPADLPPPRFPQLLPDAPPPPPGMRPRHGVEMGCGEVACTHCYEPEAK